MILVKIGKMGGSVKEMAYADNISAAKAIGDSGFSVLPSIEEVVVNKTIIQDISQYIVRNGDVILIQKKTAPSTITVKAGRKGEVMQDIIVSKDSDINSVLVKAGRLPFAYEEVWLHRPNEQKGISVSLSWKGLNEGDNIVIEEKQPLARVKRAIEQWDVNEDYDDDAIHELALNVINLVKAHYKIN
jgi:hypothetical protein